MMIMIHTTGEMPPFESSFETVGLGRELERLAGPVDGSRLDGAGEGRDDSLATEPPVPAVPPARAAGAWSASAAAGPDGTVVGMTGTRAVGSGAGALGGAVGSVGVAGGEEGDGVRGAGVAACAGAATGVFYIGATSA